MSTVDLLRRTVTVLALVACVLGVTGVAEARFTAARSGAITVGTARLVPPTAVTGTYQCRSGMVTEGVTFNVTSFADAGPVGAGYRYRIYKNPGTRIEGSATSTTRSAVVDSTMSALDGGTTHWTLTIESTLFNWTGPVWSRTINCGVWGTGSGKL